MKYACMNKYHSDFSLSTEMQGQAQCISCLVQALKEHMTDRFAFAYGSSVYIVPFPLRGRAFALNEQ